jgi:transcriptional regulator with XRE-family HTH domain
MMPFPWGSVMKKGADYLFITEWMELKGLNDRKIGDYVGVAQPTVWRWRNEQWRLNPKTIALVAEAMGIKPEDLY